MEIGIHAKLKNAPLFRYRQERRLTQLAAANQAGVSVTTWNSLENLRFDVVLFNAVIQIAVLLEVPIDEIWPEQLRKSDLRQQRTAYHRVDPYQLVQQHEQRMLLPDPSDVTEQSELRERFRQILQTLTYREREIIKLFAMAWRTAMSTV